MDEKRINEIKDRICKLPPTPWAFFDGDDFDHWILVGNDSKHMVQDDSGVPPDPELIDFILHAVDDINYLLSLINQPERSKREHSQDQPINGCQDLVYRSPNLETMSSVMKAKYEKAKQICEMR